MMNLAEKHKSEIEFGLQLQYRGVLYVGQAGLVKSPNNAMVYKCNSDGATRDHVFEVFCRDIDSWAEAFDASEFELVSKLLQENALSTNPHTGDKMQSKIPSDKYRENYDKVFRSKSCKLCGATEKKGCEDFYCPSRKINGNR